MSGWVRSTSRSICSSISASCIIAPHNLNVGSLTGEVVVKGDGDRGVSVQASTIHSPVAHGECRHIHTIFVDEFEGTMYGTNSTSHTVTTFEYVHYERMKMQRQRNPRKKLNTILVKYPQKDHVWLVNTVHPFSMTNIALIEPAQTITVYTLSMHTLQ